MSSTKSISAFSSSIKSINISTEKQKHHKKAHSKNKHKGAVKETSVDRVSVHMKEVYKSLGTMAEEVLKKLNEVIHQYSDQNIQDLKPEEHTPEATAQRIVDGVAGFFSVFKAQNPDLGDEELVNKFMETIKRGINQGYSEAMGILKDTGALEFDSVKSGIEQTMELVDEKLKGLEEELRKSLGLPPKEAKETTEATESTEGKEAAVVNE